MNAQTLGLRSVEKNITNDPQRGTTPIKVTYQGQEMSYKVASGADLDANKAAAISKFTSGVKSKYTSANYTPQYNDNGSVYYMTLIDGKKVGTLSAAISIDQGRAVSIMTNAINNNFKDYVTTSTTEAEAVSGYTETGRVAVDSYEIANNSITAIQDAINKVSSQRSALGAIQNRLEHTIANLDNVAENTQAAESRIRDLDMASEMVEYSKNNILAQAGQSMLAQANQSTQGVLSLLQ